MHGPGVEERRRARIAEAWTDQELRDAAADRLKLANDRIKDTPEYRERRRDLGRRFGAANLAAPQSAEARARAVKLTFETKLAHIPREHREEYLALTNKRFTKEERAEIVLAHAPAAVRRSLRRTTEAMERREERRKREAY